MADTQINVPQSVDAPSTYQVRDGVELLLKAVHASFTDNGAAVDWLPAVVLQSDSKHTIAHAVDQNVKVAAGSDADTSFFRGVKHAAAPAPAGGAPDYLFLFGVGVNCGAAGVGTSGLSPFNHTTYFTNNAALWSFGFDGAGNINTVSSTAHGLYETFCSFTWQSPSAVNQETVTMSLQATNPAFSGPGTRLRTDHPWQGIVGGFARLTSGTFSAEVDWDIDFGITVFFTATYWWIKRWAI